MKTKRKSIKRRKTQKQKFGGAAAKKGSDVEYVRPLLMSRLGGFRDPEFITQDGPRSIEIGDDTVFIFIRWSNKWYAMASHNKRGVSILTMLENSLAKIHLFEVPEFKIANGIITNIGKVVAVDRNSPIFNKLMQIKNRLPFHK